MKDYGWRTATEVTRVKTLRGCMLRGLLAVSVTRLWGPYQIPESLWQR